MPPSAVTRAEEPTDGPRLRLHYLDGLRGLSALYVVLHHAFLEIASVDGWLPARVVRATHWAWNGQIAVQVFIVLSGYCLMMPVARAGGLKGGWSGFVGRRARRILPPYYAAMALSLVIILCVPGMGVPQHLRWDLSLPCLNVGAIVSHLFLLQDLTPAWIDRIDYPMWSIAQEWQIYFVFAFLLLPLWRYAGIVTAVSFTALVSILLRALPGEPVSFVSPEFLFEFGAGMFAAAVTFPERSPWLAWARDRAPWGGLAAGSALLYVGVMGAHVDLRYPVALPSTFLAGIAMLCTLVWCTNSSRHGRGNNRLLRLCERPAVVGLGAFSYSLYLVHAPVLAMFTLVMRHARLPGGPAVAVELLLAAPVSLAIAYGFHLIAERPFMLGRPATLPSAEKAAILDPAP